MKLSALLDYANTNCDPDKPVLVIISGIAVPVASVDMTADEELVIELEG